MDLFVGILDNSPLMPASYRERGIASVKKYYPIEIDPNMTVEEKIPLMIEWYNETHADLVSTGVSRNDLVKIIKADRHVHLRLAMTIVFCRNVYFVSKNIYFFIFRDNAKETLQILNELNIPTLIFSAGIGNLIEGVLKLNEIFYPNLHIISNFVIFGNDASKADEGDQVIVGFQEPMVHMFNKDERTVPKDSTYFIDLAHRNNAILLGDTLTDVNMSNGLHQPNAILKIGFLNDKVNNILYFEALLLEVSCVVES